MSLVRSMKNALAPVNRIPPDIFVTIPDYWENEDRAEEYLITTTHVCRGWRKLLVSRPWLWTQLDCTHAEKTRAYVERSKPFPLDVCIREDEETSFPSSTFSLIIPHLNRLGRLSLFGSSDDLVDIINRQLHRPAPALEELKISFAGAPRLIEGTIFDGDLTSLRELRLSGVITNLPWMNLPNLTTFYFRNVPSDKITVTQLLDFFDRAPHLSNIVLWEVSPAICDTPLGRVVTLSHLKSLQISATPVHSSVMKHLSIPSGAVLILDFDFDDEPSPLPIWFPKPFDRLENILPITSINLLCDSAPSLRLNGPNGGVYIYENWTGAVSFLPLLHWRILRSLNHFPLSSTERLTIGTYRTTDEFIVYETLRHMDALRTLTLTDCLNAHFVSALNPRKNASKTLLCPALEEVILYIKKREELCLKRLLAMAKERDSKGARLSTIRIISTEGFASAKEVFKLRDHVTRVKYRLDDVVPAWDDDPDGIPDFEGDRDW